MPCVNCEHKVSRVRDTITGKTIDMHKSVKGDVTVYTIPCFDGGCRCARPECSTKIEEVDEDAIDWKEVLKIISGLGGLIVISWMLAYGIRMMIRGG